MKQKESIPENSTLTQQLNQFSQILIEQVKHEDFKFTLNGQIFYLFASDQRIAGATSRSFRMRLPNGTEQNYGIIGGHRLYENIATDILAVFEKDDLSGFSPPMLEPIDARQGERLRNRERIFSDDLRLTAQWVRRMIKRV